MRRRRDGPRRGLQRREACVGDCSRAIVCGDEVVDDGEVCDDANGCARDGCDACRTQTWDQTLLVTGAVEGRDARGVALLTPTTVTTDALGRVFVGDEPGRVRRVDVDGTVTIVAGTGSYPDVLEPRHFDAPATTIALNTRMALAVDALGNLAIADGLTGVLGADGFLRALPALHGANALAFDARGRLHAALEARIVRLEDDGTLTTVAGTGTPGHGVDGVPATASALGGLVGGLAFDAQGRLYFSDAPVAAPGGVGTPRVRRVDQNGVVTTVAGTGAPALDGAPDGDGGPAVLATLRSARAIALDPLGRLYFADDRAIRRVDEAGVLSTIVRDVEERVASASGDGGPVEDATIAFVESLAVDGRGRLVFSDSVAERVRRVEVDGVVDTILGTGTIGFGGDGGPATSASLDQILAVTIDPRGGFLFSEDAAQMRRVDVAVDDATGAILFGDASFQHIRRIDADGTIDSVAGIVDPLGPGRLDRARLYGADALVAADDALFVVDRGSGPMLRVDESSDRVDVVLGNDNKPGATDRVAFVPLLAGGKGIAFDADARALVITEHDSDSLRAVTLDVDGDGTNDDAQRWTARAMSSDDHGPAGIVFDAAGGDFLVVAEDDHCVVRVERDGVTGDTVAGVCSARGVFSGLLNRPTHVALAPGSGAVYVADTGNSRVVRIDDGDRDTFPESDSDCLRALAILGDVLSVADACQGFVVALQAVVN